MRRPEAFALRFGECGAPVVERVAQAVDAAIRRRLESAERHAFPVLFETA
ncbi:MAG: hypothetical protein FD157_3580 [Rhodocyclaceae bacterium]|nr:MAG: hypothetical protein FD157_3580 [Rhodocyclaceae bacterium]TND00622.1 MAG: hypothetical protein FD118_2992 [Rhodocyclaceae bacterium]